MTAKEAFEKTEQLIAAYERGDLVGGNPLQWIEKFGEQCFNAAREKHFVVRYAPSVEKYPTFSYYLDSINQ